MNPVTEGLLTEIAKDVVCSELPIVIKYITALKGKVPQVGLKHLALAEAEDILLLIQTDLGCTATQANS